MRTTDVNSVNKWLAENDELLKAARKIK